MKSIITAVLILTLGSVRATPPIPKPTVTIDVTNGKYGNLHGIQPTLSWRASGTSSDLDLDYEAGLNVVVEDLGRVPYNLWGRVKRSLGGGFTLGIAGKASSQSDFEDLNVDVIITGDSDSLLQVTGNVFASKNGENPLGKIQLKRSIPVVGGGRLLVNPKYDFRSEKRDLDVKYSPIEGTEVGIEAATKKLTISQSFPDAALILKPSITPSKDFALDATKKFEKYGTATLSYKPATSVNLKWQEGPWIANIHAPMTDHFSFDGCDVSFKRKVGF